MNRSVEKISFDKDIEVRTKIKTIFNKTLDDFDGDKHKYNVYLEEVEDLIFDMIEGDSDTKRVAE
jgi:CDK-activating kinase assembly factor MAT1